MIILNILNIFISCSENINRVFWHVTDDAFPKLKPHLSIASFYGTKANGADQEQTPHNAVSDLDLHCLLKGCPIEIGEKCIITPKPLKFE